MKSHLYAGALCGCAFAALAACSVGPAYKRPDIPLPAQWRDAGSEASAVWPNADWWHGFGSAKLDELIAEAKRSNDDLAVAVARVQEADAQARIAGAAASAVARRRRQRHARARAGQWRQSGLQRLQSRAHRELRAGFLGQESRLTDCRAGNRKGQPLRPGDGRPDRRQQRRHDVFPGARIARSASKSRRRISPMARQFSTACSSKRPPASRPDSMSRSRRPPWRC